ncbi:DUF5675 family protein [Elizabethkingia occulta]|uniref:DUF5675 family protein n=1 Tax=Elizabethkingia occulta TaxID=1867263 RepID=UPI00099A9A9E|nr:DUF5675 family protein [Elizabethkingia occulta]OPB97914.1 hypothetical protein BB020_13900 [Elizabethkingia occulta]
MELELIREYSAGGTNGKLYYDGVLICYTIELPWHNNRRKVSCIPEGRYGLLKRHSPKFGWHISVLNVPGRSAILFHPANYALKELQGCIAPVTLLTGSGRGTDSRKALEALKALLYPVLDIDENVFVVIRSLKK